MTSDLILRQLISIIFRLDQPWQTCRIIFMFPPTVNRGCNTQPVFQEATGSQLDIYLPFDAKLDQYLYGFIYESNPSKPVNKIVFTARKDIQDSAMITVEYDPAIVNNFLNNLPKSKRGKTIPWWQNPGEVKELI